ncbi:hypothetical protein GCM10009530_63010 [Microbispora corallina]|uniref:Uncharacterized protein n=1 Tax=Microbispora corallina TaxID=83302 RepID=A0ABQ4GCI7_9ACTN|nr:hypothetical protein Mco01_78010 [Microbispora corallina]
MNCPPAAQPPSRQEGAPPCRALSSTAGGATRQVALPKTWGVAVGPPPTSGSGASRAGRPVRPTSGPGGPKAPGTARLPRGHSLLRPGWCADQPGRDRLERAARRAFHAAATASRTGWVTSGEPSPLTTTRQLAPIP